MGRAAAYAGSPALRRVAVGSPKGTFYRTYIIPSLFLQSTISMATAERLLLDKTWFDDGRLFASWRPSARRLLHQTRCNLHRELHRSLHRSCVHLKGHGGVKGALRRIMRQRRVAVGSPSDGYR